MRSIESKPAARVVLGPAVVSLSLSLSLVAGIIALIPTSRAVGAPPATPAAIASGTTLYVNPEIGQDCLDGLSPDADLCVPPPEGGPGPFKTLTKALTTIGQNAAVGNGPPYTVRIAARWHETLGEPYIYGPAGAANYSGETFPLLVPPRTLIKADGANSEFDSSHLPVRAILEGPLYTGTATSLGPPVPDTLLFRAGGSDNFTSEGGLDGTEIPDYGIEVRRGLRNAFLEVDGGITTRWPLIPPGPAPPALPAMSIRIDSVWFSGDQCVYDLDAHITEKGIANFTVTDCQFTTKTSVFVDPFTGDPITHPFHSGEALVHLFSTGGSLPVLSPAFTRDVLTVLAKPDGHLPDVEWGMVIDANAGSDPYVRLTGLLVAGAADPALEEGIVTGIEFASNTGSPTVGGVTKIARLDLTGSEVRDCAVFGLAVATGAFNNATISQLDVSGNLFTGNGARPAGSFNGQSTHYEFRGAAVHLVRRSGPVFPPAIGPAMLVGSVSSNRITGNVTGIAYSVGGAGTPAFGDLSVARNIISGQVLYPAGYVPPVGLYGNFPGGDGVGIVLGSDTPIGQGVGVQTLSSACLIEANQIFGNARHGVWIAGWHPGALITPTLRNNRVYGNGTVFAPPLVPALAAPAAPYGAAGDGVRIEVGGTMGTGAGSVAPTLVHETVVDTIFGVGARNVDDNPGVTGLTSTIGTPHIWNSILYFNGPLTGPDLSGFTTGSPGVGGRVKRSNFCGPPWTGSCGLVSSPDPNNGDCISADPMFVSLNPPNFVLTCGAGGCAPCASASVDREGTDAPFMPPTNANGAPRNVNLTGAIPPLGPDMGALEKQSCVP